MGLRDIIKAGLGDRYQVPYSFLPAIKISKCFMHFPYHDWLGLGKVYIFPSAAFEESVFYTKAEGIYLHMKNMLTANCVSSNKWKCLIFLQNVGVHVQIFRLLTATKILNCSRLRQR